jgi:hypothetical protein
LALREESDSRYNRGGMQEYRRKYDLDTLVKEEEEDSTISATARATVQVLFCHLRTFEIQQENESQT